MKKIFFCILIPFILYSCAGTEVEIPADVLGRKEMATILTDITLAQSAYSTKTRTDSIPYKLDEYTDKIIKDRTGDKEKFLRSLKFYSNHPEILSEIYDSVITGLIRMQGEAELN